MINQLIKAFSANVPGVVSLRTRAGYKERGIHIVLYATNLSKVGHCYLLVVCRSGIELRFLTPEKEWSRCRRKGLR